MADTSPDSTRIALARRLLGIQGGVCFICQQPVALTEDWHIDHVKPRARGGKDDENNLAVTHGACNLSKLDADLRVARCMAIYEQIRHKSQSLGPNRPHLGDFLPNSPGARNEVIVRISGDKVSCGTTASPHIVTEVPLITDLRSGMTSFFIELPVEVLEHDSKINPRAIGPRVRSLIDEFLSGRPQLHIPLGWIQVEGATARTRLHIFDGQHKVCAQLLLGAKHLPVRIFVNPDIETLLEANTNAGTTLRQVAFDKAVQRFLGSQILKDRIESYQSSTGRSNDDFSFSEQELIRAFTGETTQLKRYIGDSIRTSITNDPTNRLTRDYVEFSGKGVQKPLSYSTVEKTFLSFFIKDDPLETPMSIRSPDGDNPRELEAKQVVNLMNMFATIFLESQYDQKRTTYRVEQSIRKGEDVPDGHLRATRVCREEVLYGILRIVQSCIKTYWVTVSGRVIDDADLFQQKFPDQLWERLDTLLCNLRNLPLWVSHDPNLSSAVFGGKQTYEFWKHIFDTGSTPSGMKVLAKPLNLNDLLV